MLQTLWNALKRIFNLDGGWEVMTLYRERCLPQMGHRTGGGRAGRFRQTSAAVHRLGPHRTPTDLRQAH